MHVFDIWGSSLPRRILLCQILFLSWPPHCWASQRRKSAYSLLNHSLTQFICCPGNQDPSLGSRNLKLADHCTSLPACINWPVPAWNSSSEESCLCLLLMLYRHMMTDSSRRRPCLSAVGSTASRHHGLLPHGSETCLARVWHQTTRHNSLVVCCRCLRMIRECGRQCAPDNRGTHSARNTRTPRLYPVQSTCTHIINTTASWRKTALWSLNTFIWLSKLKHN